MNTLVLDIMCTIMPKSQLYCHKFGFLREKFILFETAEKPPDNFAELSRYILKPLTLFCFYLVLKSPSNSYPVEINDGICILFVYAVV